jgi:hypothetical protein
MNPRQIWRQSRCFHFITSNPNFLEKKYSRCHEIYQKESDTSLLLLHPITLVSCILSLVSCFFTLFLSVFLSISIPNGSQINMGTDNFLKLSCLDTKSLKKKVEMVYMRLLVEKATSFRLPHPITLVSCFLLLDQQRSLLFMASS